MKEELLHHKKLLDEANEKYKLKKKQLEEEIE